MRPRVLFVAEAVTLAQVVRLRVLAASLSAEEYDVHFASARFDDLVFAGAQMHRWPIHSLSPESVARAVAAGRRVHTGRTLARYLEEDLRLLREVRPALVVGDLRLSLSVAAPLCGIPYAALANAYWSPHAVRDGWPLPDHPIVRLLGERLAAQYFPKAMPRVFDFFAAPVNRLRRRHGLPPVGSLPEVLTHGDHVLYADAPELMRVEGAPAHHQFLGPVQWSAPAARPDWWARLDPARPTAYVTFGSSGRADLLPVVLEGLAAEGVQSLVATAGRSRPFALPPHAFAADFLPGDEAAARADFVVTNGGSTTGYQALAAGRPVLGIPFNLDQYLAQTEIVRAGAGALLRAGSLCAEGVRQAARELLDGEGPRRSAAALAAVFARHDASAAFRRVVGRVCACA